MAGTARSSAAEIPPHGGSKKHNDQANRQAITEIFVSAANKASGSQETFY